MKPIHTASAEFCCRSWSQKEGTRKDLHSAHPSLPRALINTSVLDQQADTTLLHGSSAKAGVKHHGESPNYYDDEQTHNSPSGEKRVRRAWSCGLKIPHAVDHAPLSGPHARQYEWACSLPPTIL